MAVVLAVENTREEIWDALYARRTYATTGARIVLDFKVNQQHMGSWIEAAPGSTARDDGWRGRGGPHEVEALGLAL